ncbi:MAG TPA: hypothetical protein VE961_02090 [Pyrinomonadaceae bacterium]|nr:hypothetical protein [Pyrinomonadaceae bacterium]
MKNLQTILFRVVMTILLVLEIAISAGAQVTIRITPDAVNGRQQNQATEDEQLIDWVFEPITAQLQLTGLQKFKVLAIAQATINSTEPLFDQLDNLDEQLSLAAFSGSLDEVKLQQILAREAELTNQVNIMMARAKAELAKILTAQQRQMVVDQYQRPTAHLGPLSSAGN